MNYRDEIIAILNTIEQESILKFFYSLIRFAVSDAECEAVIRSMAGLFVTE